LDAYCLLVRQGHTGMVAGEVATTLALMLDLIAY
jgi:hypothetical protein